MSLLMSWLKIILLRTKFPQNERKQYCIIIFTDSVQVSERILFINFIIYEGNTLNIEKIHRTAFTKSVKMTAGHVIVYKAMAIYLVRFLQKRSFSFQVFCIKGREAWTVSYKQSFR